MNESDRQRADLAVRWTQAQPSITAFLRSIVHDPAEVDDLLQGSGPTVRCESPTHMERARPDARGADPRRGGDRIVDLGTRFKVTVDVGGAIYTEVIEGTVAYRQPHAMHMLTTNEILRVAGQRIDRLFAIGSSRPLLAVTR